MPLLPIIVAPDKRLLRTALPVNSVDSEVRNLMDNMLETMYDAPGIGLAAPQVGILKRVLVIDVSINEHRKPGTPLLIANPTISWASKEQKTTEEGCLSLPGQYAEVERPTEIRVKYINEHNKAQELEADGLVAACLQHEIDHLDGRLFINHLSRLKRNMILRRLAKDKRSAK
tara:strand:- start:129 stop:647 length:519 start_codon:yes stop_codon:yes gene_type:complete